MYRRRRSNREKIAFSFDSFLDVVANVIGIVVRLILMAWVGARSYTAAMRDAEAPPESVRAMASPSVTDDPAQTELERIRREAADARLRLLDRLGDLQLAERESRESQVLLQERTQQRRVLLAQADQLSAQRVGAETRVDQVVATAAELRKRGTDILEQIKTLESQPRQTQVLRYHTPVSRAVHADEMFFECRNGRVAFIDLPVFLQEIRTGLEGKAEALKSQWQVSSTTAQAGAFRLRYTVEREKNTLEGIGGGPVAGNYRYGMSEWTVEPLTPDRGESLEKALLQNSEFRQHVDGLDPQITVVTFWVYADSFELFRRLRDHLYERDIEVAGRPLTDDAPIAASRNGTASRGQ